MGTASGIEPELVNTLGWRARLVAAHAAPRATAWKICDTYGGPEGEALSATVEEVAGHPLVRAHVEETLRWYERAGWEADSGRGFEPLTAEEERGLFVERPPTPLPDSETT